MKTYAIIITLSIFIGVFGSMESVDLGRISPIQGVLQSLFFIGIAGVATYKMWRAEG